MPGLRGSVAVHGDCRAPSLSAATLAQQGLVAHQRGDIDTAERAYRAALAREAEHPLALHYLGVVLHQRGRHAEALPLLERSASLVPPEPEFHNNLGLVFAALDDNDRAIDSYRRALERKPDHATAWNNLGLACQAANRLPEAIASFRRALALTPGFAQAHWNLALALLANGEYAEGWREYEWRLRLPELGGQAPSLTIPRWEGEDMRGRTLLVTAEQGIGDALQFIRFVARLAERGVRVVVQAPPKLCALLATAPGVAATVSPGDPLPAYDGEIPLLSLPHRLGILADDLAAPVRYLHSDPLWHADVGAELARTGARTRNIGIAWAGAAHYRNDARRSMPLALLAPLLSLPGTTWYSLQKGPAESQAAASQRGARDGAARSEERFSARCGARRRARCRRVRRYEHRAPRRRARQAGLRAAALRARLALGHRGRADAVVSDGAPLPSTGHRRLGERGRVAAMRTLRANRCRRFN